MDRNEFIKTTGLFLGGVTISGTGLIRCNEKNKVLKLAKSIAGMEGKNTEVKLKINELVREIEKCISLVNN